MVETSYEQFRAALGNEVARSNLGFTMSPDTARWLLADDAAARAVYAHWAATGAPMQDEVTPIEPAAGPKEPGGPEKARSWTRWAIPAGAGVLGLVLGGVAGAGAQDPTESGQYLALQSQAEDLESQVEELGGRLDAEAARESDQDAEYQELLSGLVSREVAVADQEGALTEREAAVTEREAAVTAVEQQVAATSIGEGTWTVGVDVEPGTYRTAEAVTDTCYWGIYTTGTNGDDIQQNDVVTGGFPTVTLAVGQDFKNSGCGTFVKQ